MTRPRLSLPPSRQLSYAEFRDDVPAVLKNLADFLESRRQLGESPNFKEVAGQHGHCRWRQGFNLKDLIRDWGDLQRVVLEWVNRFYEEKEAGEVMDRSTATNLITAFFTEAVCGSVARFDELRQNDAARMTKELQQMRSHFDRIDNFRKRLLEELSHDMRSPLTAISGVSSVLKDEENEEANHGVGELGTIIEESVADAIKHLDSLQELSHIDSGLATLSPSRVDVAVLLRGILDEHSRTSDEAGSAGAIPLSSPASLEVEADEDRLRKTFEELLSTPGVAGGAIPPSVEAMTLRRLDDVWELQVRYAPSVAGDEAVVEASRDDIDTLVLRRLCLIQLASFQSEQSSGGGKTVTLKFPLDYRGT